MGLDVMAMVLDRVHMPERDPEERTASYDEAVLGYSKTMAQEEALRCIDCKSKPCTYACPALTRAPEYIQAIAAGDFDRSLEIACETYPLPGTLGRTCFHPCEDACVVGYKGEPVAICSLKRAAFDHGQWPTITKPKLTGKSIGVVGGGPAGLQVAYDLVRNGHSVSVYEALPELGGMMRYGIPAYRLPRDVLAQEMERMREWGVEFHTEWRLGDEGNDVSSLLEKHDQLFLGTGCHSPKTIHTEGEDLDGVTHAVDWLRELELGNPPDLQDKRLIVIGGGSTAMDVSRNALRCGAKSVHIIYRRGRRQMTAAPEEVFQARDENIKFMLLANPLRIIGDDNGHVKFVECSQMEFGLPDESGRRRPVPIPDSNLLLRADEVVLAVGQNPSDCTPLDGFVQLSQWGDIEVDHECRTNHPRIFSAGDIALGPSSIIEAIGQARKAADTMQRALAA
jgi:glutamate synthase (NADPH/NADH) small chain